MQREEDNIITERLCVIWNKNTSYNTNNEQYNSDIKYTQITILAFLKELNKYHKQHSPL